MRCKCVLFLQQTVLCTGEGGTVGATSAWHTGGPGSIHGHGRHGMFGGKTWLSTLEGGYPS